MWNQDEKEIVAHEIDVGDLVDAVGEEGGDDDDDVVVAADVAVVVAAVVADILAYDEDDPFEIGVEKSLDLCNVDLHSLECLEYSRTDYH